MIPRQNKEVIEMLGQTWPLLVSYVNATVDVDEPIRIAEDADSLVQNPDITVLVVTWRHEKYIRECVESICQQQTNYSFEVIVGEDSSPDNTREICFQLQKQYPRNVRVVYSEHNVGLVANTYRIANLIRGRYVAICEGDDYWIDPQKLQKEVSFLVSNSDFDVVHTACYHQYERNKFCRCPLAHRTIRRLLSYNYLRLNLQQQLLAACNFISTPTLVVRSEAYLKAIEYIRELESLTGWIPSTDYVTNFFSCMNGKVYFISDITAVYRVNAGSLTGIVDRRKALARQLGDARNGMVLKSMCGGDDGFEKIRDLCNKLQRGAECRNYHPHRGPLYFLLRRVLIEIFGV